MGRHVQGSGDSKTRKGMNVMTSKFVAKWRGVVNEKTGQTTWTVRMRMTVRGFQDWYAHLYETYAGTASRLSQRLVASEIACRARENWVLSSFDVEKAFLQGMTYEELHNLTGEAPTKVFFILPPGAAALLRRLKGFERYDERYQVLQALIPATGTADAPRAFALKLSQVMSDHGNLVGTVAKHSDDVHMGGTPHETKETRRAVGAEFGALSWQEKEFTSVGVHHKQHPNGDVELDQDVYIAQLTPITGPDLLGKPPEELANDALKFSYASLSGGLAYALLTQHWVSVYVVALQLETSRAHLPSRPPAQRSRESCEKDSCTRVLAGDEGRWHT